MSDLLSIGATGVRAYQTALETVGDNIANSGTAGYSRRVAGLREISVGTGLAARGTNAGAGVLSSGIQRTSDGFAAAAARSAATDLTRTTTSASWLDRVGTALDGNAVGTRLTQFFNAADALAAEPASSALRASFLGAAGNVADAVSATGKAFDQVDKDIDAQATQAAQTLTTLGASLARINDGLGRTQANTTASSQLLDQRDAILDQMSALSDLQTTSDPLGRTTVALGPGSGVPFVEIDRANTVAYRRNGDSVGFTVSNPQGAATLDPTGGSLAGYVEGAQRSSAARQGIEDIATRFTDAANAVQQQGYDLNGDRGQPLFTVGVRATDVSVDPTLTYDKVAASGEDSASDPPRSLGQRDGSNLAAFAAIRSTTGVEAKVTGIVTANAAQLQQRTTIAEAQTAIRTGAQTALATATGVNLDAEAIDLVRFQQAYQASSRAIQVARDTLQSILDIR